MWKRAVPVIILFLFSSLMLWLALERHREKNIEFWQKEIYSDKAGYYAYLPAAFIYHFDAARFPKDCDLDCGNGFNLQDGKVITKYPYGVSLLNAPFFLFAHLITFISGGQMDGFSFYYAKMVDVAAAFYLFLGLLYLFRFLRKSFNRLSSWITVIFILAGTSLLFYTTDDPGMSHVYSFSLFSMLLYFHQRLLSVDGKAKLKYVIIVSLLISLIVAVRNLNVLFIPFCFFYNVKSRQDIKNVFAAWFNWRYILILLGIFVLIAIPQLLYWKYAYNEYFKYSYEGETFSNLASPEIVKLLFSARGGVFLYNPLIFFVLLGSIIAIFKRKAYGWLSLTSFLLLVYLYASWHDWSLGNSFGCRTLVDILPLLAVGLAFLIEKFRGVFKGIVIALIFVVTLFTINIFSNFGLGYTGLSDWDWYEYNYSVYSGCVVKSVVGPNYYQEKPDYLIALKSSKGKYVCLQDNFSLVANADTFNSEVVIKLINTIPKDRRIALKGANGYYLQTNMFDRFKIYAIAEKRVSWETFYLEKQADGRYAIKNFDNFYVSADADIGDTLVANRTGIGEWELFRVDTLWRY